MNLGDKLQILRKSRGWSQEDLAKELKVSRQAISKWEQNTVMPDTANVMELGALFGVTTDYLLYDKYESGRPGKLEGHMKIYSKIDKKIAAEWIMMVGGGIVTLILLIAGCVLGAKMTPDISFYNNIDAFLSVYCLKWLFVIAVSSTIVGTIAYARSKQPD